MPLVINSLRGGHAHINTHTHTHTHTYRRPCRNNFKKPDTCRPAASTPGIKICLQWCPCWCETYITTSPIISAQTWQKILIKLKSYYTQKIYPSLTISFSLKCNMAINDTMILTLFMQVLTTASMASTCKTTHVANVGVIKYLLLTMLVLSGGNTSVRSKFTYRCNVACWWYCMYMQDFHVYTIYVTVLVLCHKHVCIL